MDFYKNFMEGVEWIRKTKRAKEKNEPPPTFEKWEKSTETEGQPTPVPPPVIPNDDLIKKSTGGSKPFSKEEIARGYRKL